MKVFKLFLIFMALVAMVTPTLASEPLGLESIGKALQSADETVSAAGVSASDVECVDLVGSGGQGKYVVCFLGVDYNGDGTSTWTYSLENVGAQNLSHWVLGTCEEPQSSGNYTVIGEYNGVTGRTGRNYPMVWGQDKTTFGSGTNVFKFDETQTADGETEIFQFTMDGAYGEGSINIAAKSGRNTGVGFGSITGPDCNSAPQPTDTPTPEPTNTPTPEPTNTPTPNANGCAADPLGIATNFNVFTLGNHNSSNGSDTEGRMAVGGNATLGSYSVGYVLNPNEASGTDVLIVGGDLNFTSGQIYYGNAVYGGQLSASGSATVDGEFRQDNPINFASSGNDLVALSQAYAALSANGSATMQWGTLTLSGSDSQTNIFEITAAQLQEAHTLVIDIPDGATALINISGADANFSSMGIFGSNNSSSVGLRNRVLYNFYEATELDIYSIGVDGSVLAPLADLYFPHGVIWGTQVTASMEGAGQSNHVPFEGCLPVNNTPQPTPTPVPTEPPTAVTLKSFTTEMQGNVVIINWETATETDNAGFNIYRVALDGTMVKVNGTGLIGASADATAGSIYSITDTPGFGSFTYVLEDIDFNGISTQYDSAQVQLLPLRSPLYRPTFAQ